MKRRQLACTTFLPLVTGVSALAQDQPRATAETSKPREVSVPDSRREPTAVRVAHGKLYSLVPLADGRMLAFDRRDRKPVYLMTKTQPPDGQYLLAVSGSLIVRGGSVIQVVGTGQSTAHSIKHGGTNPTVSRGQALDSGLVVKWRVPLRGDAARRITAGQRRASVIDLKDGRLMLIEGNRIHQLRIRLANDGEYRSPLVGLLTVSRGAVPLFPNNDPDFDYDEDFAP